MTTIEAPVSPTGDSLVPLITWVLASRVLDVQAKIAEIVGGPVHTGDGPYQPPHASNFGPHNAWDLPSWPADATAPAEWILADLGTNQRRVLAALLAHGTDGIWTGELKRITGYDNATSTSGVFKAIGGRFRAVGLRPLWNGGPKSSQKGQRLSVQDPTVRALFIEVIVRVYPDLAEEYGLS